jgi:hypothetical protein
MAIVGGCLCGAIRYQIDGELARAGSCHCSMCRKAHGAAFGTYAEVPEGAFRWTAGEEEVRTFESSPGGGRAFCPRCGSTLGTMDHGHFNWVTLGTVDGDPGIRPQAHIFVSSKAPWDDINDDLPCFDEFPPSD